MYRFLLAVALLFFSTTGHAQDMMPASVRPDRIMIGKEFVPRRLDLPRVKVVAAGESFEPAADSTFDYIEVAGTLKVSRTRNTVLRFQHLFVLPGGTIDTGTVAAPIPASVRVELIVLDVPIDTTKDLFQWGNGLLNFGHRFSHGAKKLEWTTLTADVKKGETAITLAEDPVGWATGDELLVPETDAPPVRTAPRREAAVTIAGIDGRTVTLSKPLDFDHLAQRDPDGNIVLLPRVANLTRNVVIRSENPKGTPGHVADIGHGAMWDVRYSTQSSLGRTRSERLDNTTEDAVHIGTNQAGRYADHHHHAMGLGSTSVGNVYRGSATLVGKWGLVIHATHDSRIERNVAIDFTGAGFVTEDGYEVRNVFKRNFGAYNINPGNLASPPDIAVANANAQTRNAPGIEGACGWFRSVMNAFEGNECWANGTGIDLFNTSTLPGNYPSVPGGPNDTPLNQFTSKPLLFTGNVTASNVAAGFEGWGTLRFPYTNHIASYNGVTQFFFPISRPTQPYLVNPTAVGKNGTTVCLHVSSGYTETLEVEGGKFMGCGIGVTDGGAILSVKISNAFFQNALDFEYQTPARVMEHTNVLHKPMPGREPHYIQFGRAVVWPGPPTRLPGAPSGLNYYFQRGGRIHVLKNWQGTGKDYRLIEAQQLTDAPAWPSESGQHIYGSPEAGLTMGQTWAKYGQAWGGEAVDPAKLVKLEGIVAPSLIVEGSAIPFGPPRAILTYPTPRAPAEVLHDGAGKPYIELEGLVTGDPAAASEDFMLSIDDGTAQKMEAHREWAGDQRKLGVRILTEGVHTVKTWRTTKAGAKIPASEMTFSYRVGNATQTDRP